MNLRNLFIARSPKNEWPHCNEVKVVKKKRPISIKRLFVTSPVRQGMDIIHLRGVYATKKVYLNGEELTPEHPNKIGRMVGTMFSWGEDSHSGRLLAYAVLLECLREDLAYKHLDNFFWNEGFYRLNEVDFDIKIDIDKFLARQSS